MQQYLQIPAHRVHVYHMGRKRFSSGLQSERRRQIEQPGVELETVSSAHGSTSRKGKLTVVPRSGAFEPSLGAVNASGT